MPPHHTTEIALHIWVSGPCNWVPVLCIWGPTHRHLRICCTHLNSCTTWEFTQHIWAPASYAWVLLLYTWKSAQNLYCTPEVLHHIIFTTCLRICSAHLGICSTCLSICTLHENGVPCLHVCELIPCTWECATPKNEVPVPHIWVCLCHNPE